MSDQKLSREVFMALAAIGWADGELDQEEADAIVRLAADEGLELEEIAEIEAATKDPASTRQLNLENLPEADRLFVYAVASWMTRLDGQTSVGEEQELERLGAALALSQGHRIIVNAISRDIEQLPKGSRPARYDLGKLKREIIARLNRKSDRPPRQNT